MEVAGQVALRFTDGAGVEAPVNLTAVGADGARLWVAGDETAVVGRLVLDSAVAPTRAGRQRGFRLSDVVQLPGSANGEADLKGIACTGGWLWAIGSHALVRRRPKPEHDDVKVVRRLGKLRRDPNRFVIVRLALQLGVDRHPEPVRVSRDGRRSALIGAPGAETLVDLLRSDAHLAPFLAIPGQDNGFECQGLAAVGDRLYIGLRGPVLRGWAVVLEVRPAQDPTDPGRLSLGILAEGARYRKHFLDLGGLGVRGLVVDGEDLLVLAGPAMAVPGPVRVHRWSGAAAAPAGPVLRAADLPVEAELPHGEGDDHPASMTLLAADPNDPRLQLLTVYDEPSAPRVPWPGTVLADRIRIGPDPAGVAAAGVAVVAVAGSSVTSVTAVPPDVEDPPESDPPDVEVTDVEVMDIEDADVEIADVEIADVEVPYAADDPGVDETDDGADVATEATAAPIAPPTIGPTAAPPPATRDDDEDDDEDDDVPATPAAAHADRPARPTYHSDGHLAEHYLHPDADRTEGALPAGWWHDRR